MNPKYKKELCAEFGISLKTLNKYLEQAGIILPKKERLIKPVDYLKLQSFVYGK